MTTQENLQTIRQKCVEANPEIEDTCTCGNPFKFCCCNTFFPRDIRLADVLLALGGKQIRLAVSSHDGLLWLATEDKYDWEWLKPSKGVRWNLRQDSLDCQSPETIDFLYQLLA